MRTVSKILDILCDIFKWITVAFLGIMLIVSLVEIVRRYIMGHSFPWADELIRYSIVVVASMGGSIAYRKTGGLVAFDLVQTHVHGKVRLVLELVINTIVFGFTAYMLRNSIVNLASPSIQRQTSIGLQISMFWPYLPVTLGMGMLVLLSLEKYYTVIRDYRAGEYGKKQPQLAEGGSAE